MKFATDTAHQRLWNHAFGMVIAIALVWGFYVSSKPPAALRNVPEIGVMEIVSQRTAGKAPVIIDVRGPEAYGRGHIDGALHIPLDDLQARAKELPTDLAASMVVYCGDGSTLGPRGTAKLQSMGYTRVANLSGGIEGWRSAGQAVKQGKG